MVKIEVMTEFSKVMGRNAFVLLTDLLSLVD